MRWKFWKRDEVRVVKPLPARIDEVVSRLEMIRTRLRRRINDLKMRDHELFEHVIKAKMNQELEEAAVYANELSELRKMLKRAIYSDLLLEGVIYRIQAVKELDEIGDVMTPIREILLNIGKNLRGVAPSLSTKVSEIIDSVESISVELGSISETYIPERALSNEAEKILSEASAIASQRKRDKGLEAA